MNLPNKITIARIILIPLMLLFMLPIPLQAFSTWNQFVRENGMIVALIVFSIASYTDHLDGAIARKRNIVTNMGKFLDPIADKLLIMAALIALVELGLLTAWVPVIVLFREFAVTGIRMLAIERGEVIAAGKLGKLKMVVQITAIILIMLVDIIGTKWFHEGLMSFLSILVTVVVILTVILTLVSGLDYALRNKDLFRDHI